MALSPEVKLEVLRLASMLATARVRRSVLLKVGEHPGGNAETYESTQKRAEDAHANLKNYLDSL